MMGRQLAAQLESPAGAGHAVADQSEVAAFLSRPATYGSGVQRVERIDTHGAMVFLAAPSLS